MKWDFRHHLLLQIEMLRGELSHQELSERLGDIHERSLARYIAGKCHLTEAEFKEVAQGLRRGLWFVGASVGVVLGAVCLRRSRELDGS